MIKLGLNEKKFCYSDVLIEGIVLCFDEKTKRTTDLTNHMSLTKAAV